MEEENEMNVEEFLAEIEEALKNPNPTRPKLTVEEVILQNELAQAERSHISEELNNLIK